MRTSSNGYSGEQIARSAVQRSLRHVSSLFEKLLYIASARDRRTGVYSDPLLAFDVGPAELDGELRLQHRKIFTAWLAGNLEAQYTQLQNYFRVQSAPPAGLRLWLEQHGYERLIPPAAPAPERELFLSDFEVLAALLSSETEEMARGVPCQSAQPLTPALLNASSESELKTFLYRVMAKEHLVDLWEKGKIKAELCAEGINRLRKAVALPAIHPAALRRRNAQR